MYTVAIRRAGMGRLPWLLGWLLLWGPLDALAASVIIGRTVAPEVEEKDWTTNAVLKTKLRDALSLCISSAPASHLAEKPTADKGSAKLAMNGAGRVQRAATARGAGVGKAMGVGAGAGEGNAPVTQSEAPAQEREAAAVALDLGDAETDNRTPCIPTEIASDEELGARRKNTRRRTGSSTSGGRRYADAFDGSSSRAPRRSKSEDRIQTETISMKGSHRNASRLGALLNDSHNPMSASYQYQVPDYGGGWGSSSRGGGQWGGGGGSLGGYGVSSGGYGDVDFRYGGSSHSLGGGSYEGHSGGDVGYRGGYGGGSFGDSYGTSNGGFGSNGRRGGYPRSGSGSYGDSRNYGFSEGSDFDSGFNNGNSRNKFGARRDWGGSRSGDQWGESDGETFHRVGSGGFSGNRRDNRNGGHGNSRARGTRFQDDSRGDDDSESEDSEEDDDEDDGYRGGRGGRRRGHRGEDDRRSRGSSRSRNSRGKRVWSGKGRLLEAVDPGNAFGEVEESGGGGSGGKDGAMGSPRRRQRSAPVKLRSRDGGYPCAVQCALTHMGVVDDLGFPCEESMRRVLRKMLGDGDGAVAAKAVSRCMLRVSGAVDEDSCDAADRLVECLRVDVDALLREMTAPEVEATTLPPALIAPASATASASTSAAS